MGDQDWYYCLTHHAVEPYEGCKSAMRLGPYGSREEAEEALEKVKRRNQAWDDDPRFDEDD